MVGKGSAEEEVFGNWNGLVLELSEREKFNPWRLLVANAAAVAAASGGINPG